MLKLFYELFFVFKYLTKNDQNFKLKNVEDLIKYFELKQYELNQLNNAKKHLRDKLSLDNILYFYDIVENEAFNYLTLNIQDKIINDGVGLGEEIVMNIEQCLNENKIITINNIISAMKKYILRNIKGKNEDKYLFKLNDLKDKNLWDITIFATKEFNEDFNKLIKLDMTQKNVVIYLYSKIYSIDIREEEYVEPDFD